MTQNGWIELRTADGDVYYYNELSQESTWDKPDALLTDDEREVGGEWVWAPDDVQGFVPARVVEKYYNQKILVQLEDGRVETISETNLTPIQRQSNLRRIVPDLVMLEELNNPMILHNLRARFESNGIYTNVGTILIAVNPYQPLGLYTPSIMAKYQEPAMHELPPHVFEVAHAAYRDLTENSRNQSIIISGESGAGKTESAKHCMQYFADVAGSSGGVEQKVLLANPILEAFGNAKTLKNNNSSRFGKYVEVYFDAHGRICGASNTNYLLEKVRVVKQADGERNFHVFYQLTCASQADNYLYKQLNLGPPREYNYLNKSGTLQVENTDDVLEFHDLIGALSQLGISGDESGAMFRVVAAVLHLGNIEFDGTGDRVCKVVTPSALDDASQLLGVTKDALCQAVTSRLMRIRGQETTKINLGCLEAASMRDALAKFIYARLFDWIVERINEAVAREGNSVNKLGALDIFGFEIFRKNSFEQLCINYANEQLQQLFNRHTFKLEEQLYRAEQVKFDHIDYIDNQPVLDLIERKPDGILSMLDEEIIMPQGSDDGFVQKLHSVHAASKDVYKKVTRDPRNFTIIHYAGEVEYESEGLLEKNRDSLNADLLHTLGDSSFNFLKKLFRIGEADSKTRKATLGTQFKQQLGDLMSTLDSTEPHYIRCIKPNEKKEPGVFSSPLVLEQLRYSGVLEAVQIRRSGYPWRLPHEMFIRRYRCIADPGKSLNFDCRRLVELMGVEVQIGRTRVLYRASAHKTMELKRNLAIERHVTRLQAYVRRLRVKRMVNEWYGVRPAIRSAVLAEDLKALEVALSQASIVRLHVAELVHAKAFKETLLKRQVIEDRLKVLIQQDPDKVFDELSREVASSREVELKSDIARRAIELLQLAIDRRQCKADLDQGIALADKSMLESGIKLATRLTIDCKEARAMLVRVNRELELAAAVDDALFEGGWVRESDVVSFKHLDAAIKKLVAVDVVTVLGKGSVSCGCAILTLRCALASALGTKSREFWDPVQAAISAAPVELENHAEIQAARNAVLYFIETEEVEKRLFHGIQTRDLQMLKCALHQAADLRMNEQSGNGQKYQVVGEAQHVHDLIVYCRDALEKAIKAVREDPLHSAVKFADDLCYQDPLVDRGRTLLERVRRMQHDAAIARDVLEPDHMEALVKEADEIGFKNDDIAHLRTLLYDTSAEKFVQLQLKAAVRLRDEERITRVTIRLKDLFLDGHADDFVLHRYAKLRTAEEWASIKLFGFAKNKDQLAAGFMQWTSQPIHAPLSSELNSRLEKKAKTVFKTIMSYMGDRVNATDPLFLAREIVEAGLENEALRPEIYLQLIKQVTNNPSTDSIFKGWELLSLCLQSFTSSDFENYLEVWLRSNPYPEARKYVTILHKTVYGGTFVDVPSDSEIQNALMHQGNLRSSVSRRGTATRQTVPPPTSFNQQLRVVSGNLPAPVVHSHQFVAAPLPTRGTHQQFVSHQFVAPKLFVPQTSIRGAPQFRLPMHQSQFQPPVSMQNHNPVKPNPPVQQQPIPPPHPPPRDRTLPAGFHAAPPRPF